jgi:hypothetical protein
MQIVSAKDEVLFSVVLNTTFSLSKVQLSTRYMRQLMSQNIVGDNVRFREELCKVFLLQQDE